MKKIKVAFIHPVFPSGGAERVTADIIEYLTPRGYEFYIFVDFPNGLDRNILTGACRDVTYIAVDIHNKDVAVPAQKIADEVNRHGIDIFVNPISFWGTDAVRRNTRCKIVYANHGLPMWQYIDFLSKKSHEVVRAGIGKMAEWFLLRFPREMLTRYQRKRHEKEYKDNYLNCDTYTVLCEPYKTRLLEILGPPVATTGENHIAVVPNYVAPVSYGGTGKQKKVLFMGRLSHADKRVDRLLDIWARVYRDFPDWTLDIVGPNPEGGEKDRLLARALRLGLERVAFHGNTTTPEEFYCSAAILCLTSTYEGWGLVISEAQQAGVVPIAFDCSAGVAEQISPSGVNGILVKPFDKKEYARQLARLMSDDDLRERMSKSVVEKARDYSDEGRLQNWDKIFRRLVEA